MNSLHSFLPKDAHIMARRGQGRHFSGVLWIDSKTDSELAEGPSRELFSKMLSAIGVSIDEIKLMSPEEAKDWTSDRRVVLFDVNREDETGDETIANWHLEHPDCVLQDPSLKKKVWSTLQKIQSELGKS